MKENKIYLPNERKLLKTVLNAMKAPKPEWGISLEEVFEEYDRR